MNEAAENLSKALDDLLKAIKGAAEDTLFASVWWGVPVWKVLLVAYAIIAVTILITEVLL